MTDLPCSTCGHELIEYDLSEDGIGVEIEEPVGYEHQGRQATRTVPGYECPECGHQGPL